MSASSQLKTEAWGATAMSSLRKTILMAHPGAELYGADRMFLEAVAGAANSGAQVIAALPNTGPLVPLLREAGADVRITATPVLRKTLLNPRGLVDLAAVGARSAVSGWKLLQREHVDVVYVNTVTIPLWLILGRVCGKHVVAHVHEAESTASKPILQVLTAPLKLADTVLVNSEFARSVLATVSSQLAVRSVHLPNGIACPEPAPQPPRENLDDAVRLAFLGRLSERKGVQVALDAFHILAERGQDVELKLLGDFVPGYDEFRSTILSKIEQSPYADKIHISGFVEPIWDALADADIVMTPSVVDEPFGNTAVEGVLACRPVVVSDAAGLAESADIYDSLVACEPGSANAVADGVAKIVREWTAFRARAVENQALARRSHATESYRQGIRKSLNVAGQIPRQVRTRDIEKAPQVVVAACTYKRNELLPELIPALIAEAQSVEPAARVLIVDNDPDAGARDICVELLGEHGWYAHEPRGAICEARNKCLDESIASGADVMVFIDDDETPEAGWLQTLLDTYQREHCAAVVGPVVPRFTAEVPTWIAEGRFFDTTRRPSGTRVPMAATNNLLLDLHIVQQVGVRFDSRYSYTGGGDSAFTWSLTRMGHEIVWADDAVVHDLIPESRLNRRWLMRRAVRLANSRPRVDLHLTQGGAVNKIALRGKYIAGGIARVGAGSARALAGVAMNDGWHRGRGLRTAARGVGMISGAVGHAAAEYKRKAKRT